MLLRHTGEGAFAITQPAHAWLCGIMAEAWGNERFAPPQPRREVALAAGLHDLGWLDWERRPEFDPRTGLPRVFADVPAEEHTQLWLRGVEHVATYSRYAAALVSMHGDTIYDETFDPATARLEAAEAVRRFRATGAVFQKEASAKLRADPVLASVASPTDFAFNKRLIAALDTLSLQICWGVEEAEIADVPLSATQTTTLTLTTLGRATLLRPWPFERPALTLHLQGRHLRHAFDSQAALDAALEEAETSTLEIRLERG